MKYLTGLAAVATLFLMNTNVNAEKRCARVHYEAGTGWIEYVPCPR